MAQPEKTFRLGHCSASVFVNKARESGSSFRSVSLQRRYKDGDEWKSSTNFSLADLPHAITVLQWAMNFIAELEADDGD